MRITRRPVHAIQTMIMNIVKDRHPQPLHFVLLLFSDMFKGCVLMVFAFGVMSVLSLDETVVEAYPFV